MGRDRSTWLVLLFLLAGVAAPAAAVLWFMNAAATSEAAAARQSVVDAYRGQLRLIRDRVNSEWETRAAQLAKTTDFAQIVALHAADSAIFLRADGTPLYPAPPKTPSADPAADRAEWRNAQLFERAHNCQAAANVYANIARSDPDVSLAGRAAQSQIRCLLQDDKPAALNAIQEYFGSGRLLNALDLQGRMIAADEWLLALRLGSKDKRRLARWVNNYQVPLPSSQRLFLMSELGAASFPAYDAEKLAAQVLEADQVRPGHGLESTRVPDVWKLTAKGGRLIALFRTQTALAMLSLPDPMFHLIPPGTQAPDEAIAAGTMFPGWQIAFTLNSDRWLAEAARRRERSYFAAGYLVIAALCVTGLLLGQIFRRQMRLTRLKADLVATVSHELKTPLASMRLLVDALLEDNLPDPNKTREYLQLISGENVRLTRLIENFLTFSRIERKRQSFEFSATEPRRIVEAAVLAMRERCAVSFHVEPDLPNLYVDESALVTVIVNLLENAFKYTPADKKISLRAFRKGRDVVFAVEDNGIGISPREQKKIFRKFYQVDQRLARETGGCGLGLSIVDYIVRAHGGSVAVRSERGAGSTFLVLLPQ